MKTLKVHAYYRRFSHFLQRGCRKNAVQLSQSSASARQLHLSAFNVQPRLPFCGIFSVFMLLLFKFAISNSPKIGNLALTFPIACGKLINADEAACLISLDADIAQLVERLIRNHQVKGSSPFIGSIFYRGVAQFGSAFGSGPKGRGFESRHFDAKNEATCNKASRFFCALFANMHRCGTGCG